MILCAMHFALLRADITRRERLLWSAGRTGGAKAGTGAIFFQNASERRSTGGLRDDVSMAIHAWQRQPVL